MGVGDSGGWEVGFPALPTFQNQKGRGTLMLQPADLPLGSWCLRWVRWEKILTEDTTTQEAAESARHRL